MHWTLVPCLLTDEERRGVLLAVSDDSTCEHPARCFVQRYFIPSLISYQLDPLSLQAPLEPLTVGVPCLTVAFPVFRIAIT